MTESCIARQPIVDQRREVHGYELLFRNAASDHRCAEQDGDKTSARLVMRALIEIGIDRAASGRMAFVNCTEGFLGLQGIEEVLSPKAIVLEVLESVKPTASVVARLRQLSALGFKIALDDFAYRPELDPLLDLADYVKVDVQALSPLEVRQHASMRRSRRYMLVAEKVETYDEFRRCLDLGFDLFQGWFFCKPEMVRSDVPVANRFAALEVVARLHQDVAIDEVVRLVSLDAALSYCVLRVANGALYARPNPIESIHEGIMRIGIARFRRWLAVIMMAGLDNKPRELLVTAIVRGRMCEVLGRERGADSDAMFTLGLFSVLDALFDCPLARVLSQVRLATPLKNALLHGSGVAGAILADVIAFERGLESSADTFLATSWTDALEWADGMLEHLGLRRPGKAVEAPAPQPVG